MYIYERSSSDSSRTVNNIEQQAFLGFQCSSCTQSFSCQRALWSHERHKHKVGSSVNQFLTMSLKCPVCAQQFTSPTRLQAHVSEKWLRGMWKTTCYQVLMSGLIAPVSAVGTALFVSSCAAARLAAQRKGSTQPTVGHSRANNTRPRLPQIRVPRLGSKRSPEAHANLSALCKVFKSRRNSDYEKAPKSEVLASNSAPRILRTPGQESQD